MDREKLLLDLEYAKELVEAMYVMDANSVDEVEGKDGEILFMCYKQVRDAMEALLIYLDDANININIVKSRLDAR